VNPTTSNEGLPKKPDAAYPTPYFLSHITKLDPKKCVKLVKKIGANGQMLFKPEGLVFQEDPTTLLAANGNKIMISRWIARRRRPTSHSLQRSGNRARSFARSSSKKASTSSRRTPGR